MSDPHRGATSPTPDHPTGTQAPPTEARADERRTTALLSKDRLVRAEDEEPKGLEDDLHRGVEQLFVDLEADTVDGQLGIESEPWGTTRVAAELPLASVAAEALTILKTGAARRDP